MKKISILLLSFLLSTATLAQTVTNTNGDRFDLKEDGTWSPILLTETDFVNDGSKFVLKIPGANDQDIEITVTPDISLMDKGIKLKRKDVDIHIRLSSISAQYTLKNRYSYIPKNASIKQRGNNLTIALSYTGQNSYGADVASYYSEDYYVQPNGSLKKIK